VTCLTECYDPADMETSLPGDIPARRSRASFWLAGVFLLCFTYFLPKPRDWNQNARLDLTLAMVNHGTVRTDPYHWQAGDDVLYSSTSGNPMSFLRLELATVFGKAAAVERALQTRTAL
jgi:hypothetical protein